MSVELKPKWLAERIQAQGGDLTIREQPYVLG
jgi:hypothetical protein